MAIQTFNTLAQAQAVADPKAIWHNINKFIVYTGTDIPTVPAPTQDEIDAAAAKSYAKLNALSNMTPAQIQTWVTNNVLTLADATDAIKTLAIAVSILARRL
jgi:hypothetical protein